MGIFGHDRHALGGQARLQSWLSPLGLVVALASVPTERAAAQGAVGSVHKDWQIRCDTPPGATSAPCAPIQSVTAADRAHVGLPVIAPKTADLKRRLMPVV